MGKELGRLLRQLRGEQRLSQAQLAARLAAASGSPTISRHEISRHERGVRTPVYWLPWYARVLDVPIAKLRRVAEGAHDPPGPIAVGRQQTLAPDPAESSERAIIMAAVEESSDHGHIVATSNVGETELRWLEESLDRVALDLLTGPLIPLVLEMRQIRDQAFTALEGRQYPRQSRRLYAVGARACGLLAVVTADRFGLYDAAGRHAYVASSAADLAEEPGIGAWTQSLRSTIAFWQGRYRTAATIAQDARSIVPGGVERARLAAFEARAWAKLGDRDSMNSALDEARRCREGVGPSAGVGAIAYPLSDQIRMAGTAHLWIGDSARAKDELAEALSLLAEEYDSLPHVAVTRTDLALAHLEAGSLDDAAEVLSPLFTMTGTYLAGAVRRSSDLRSALQQPRYATSHAARQLTAEIEDFVAAQTNDDEAAETGVTRERLAPQ